MIIKQPLLTSFVFHFILMLALIVTAEFAEPLAVLHNTSNPDTIQAVMIGDSASSKLIAPKKQIAITKPKPPTVVIKKTPPLVAPPVIEKKILPTKILPKAIVKPITPVAVPAIKIKPPAVKKEQLVNPFQQTLQAQSEKTLGDEMLADLKLKSTQAHAAAGEINKYKALIVQSISENWLVPVNANHDLSCVLMIQLSSTGQVRDVQITKSSGDAQLDSSARAAVFRASPLPVPADADAFKPFQHFLLKVKPESILKNS